MSLATARTGLYGLNIIWSFLVLVLEVAMMIVYAVQVEGEIIFAPRAYVLLVWAFLAMMYFSISRRNKFNSVLADLIILCVLFLWGVGLVGFCSQSIGRSLASSVDDYVYDYYERDLVVALVVGGKLDAAALIIAWLLIVSMVITIIVVSVGALKGRKQTGRVWSKTLYEVYSPQNVYGGGAVPGMGQPGMMHYPQPMVGQGMPGQPMMMPVQQPDGSVVYQNVQAVHQNGHVVYHPVGGYQPQGSGYLSPGQTYADDASFKNSPSVTTPPLPALPHDANQPANHNSWNNEQANNTAWNNEQRY